jgi:hypothetical protein
MPTRIKRVDNKREDLYAGGRNGQGKAISVEALLLQNEDNEPHVRLEAINSKGDHHVGSLLEISARAFEELCQWYTDARKDHEE